MRTWRSRSIPLIGAMAVALFCVGGANASTVYLSINFLIFDEGSPAETNTVSIKVENGAFTVTDSTAMLSGGTGCDQVDEHTATCGFPTPVWIVVDVGHLNDSFTTDVPHEVEVQGGAGDDTLTYTGSGKSAIGALFGEDGNDTLITGNGDDYLHGGPGNDALSDGGNGAGVRGRLLGGDGDDTLQGGGGFDCLAGGAGVDSLSGELGGDILNGQSGNDSLHGNDGNDVLIGGGGDDFLSGSAGKDGFAAQDNRLDKLRGGIGTDRAYVDRGLDKKRSIENLLFGRQHFPGTGTCGFSDPGELPTLTGVLTTG
jgi:Ca2+-binding RTX toxin-like protein